MSLQHRIEFGNAQQLLSEEIGNKAFTQVFVFGDSNTIRDCLPKLTQLQVSDIIEMPAGEIHKSITTCVHVWTKLIEKQADRKSVLINLGGGVVTDLGGFAASCYKRGIAFINIPTSLLAMVDASVGGKTGVDFADIKNSIGSFANPELVIIDTDFLQSLPPRQFNNGIAEILKHGFIADATHLNTLDQAEQTNSWNEVIKQSVAIKESVVLSDPFEKGLRKILNFGHTIGHAIESYSLQHEADPLLHGEAIAMGMIAEAKLSINYCGLSMDDYQQVKSRILKYFKLRSYPKQIIPNLIALMENDKKNEQSEIQMSLLEAIGKATFGVKVKPDDISITLEEFAQ